MEKIAFQTNIPVEVRLKFIEGLAKESNFGGTQHMFSTVDGKVFFVSESVGGILAKQLKKQNVQPGEPVEIVKAEVDTGKGRKSIQWQAYKVGFGPGEDGPIGEQPDGTFVVPTGKAGASAVTPAPVAATDGAGQGRTTSSPYNNGNGSRPVNGNGANAAPYEGRPKTQLEDALKTAVAAAHAAQEYARAIGYVAMPQFSSEDIRTMANTIMIQHGGGR